MPKRWKCEELDELARRHIEYEVRKLVEYVRELETDWAASRHVAARQALIEASLTHLRNLHEFLRPSGDSDQAHAALYVDTWIRKGFLTGKEFGRLSGKVAHLSRSRLLTEHADYRPAEIRPLAITCCKILREFLGKIPSKWTDAFAETRSAVDGFLDPQAY